MNWSHILDQITSSELLGQALKLLRGVPLKLAIPILAISTVALVIILRVFESRHHASMEKKGWTIALLKEQIKMATEYDRAREVAESVHSEASDFELKALAFLVARPRLLETFLSLSEHVQIWFPKDPLEEPIQWERRRPPNHEEIEEIAAARVLRDRDYITGVLVAAFEGYSVFASNEAMAVRAAFDRLPETVKADVRKEQRRQESE